MLRSILLLLGLLVATAGAAADTFVWTWDRNEDLGFLPPAVGVALVEASIELRGERTAVRPRYTRLHVNARAPLLPVVHVDAAAAWRPALDARQKQQIVDVAAAVARRYGRQAVQLDFEALPSQRAFYGEVLHELRRRLPHHRLSITALVSWCADPDLAWLKQLPVDEIVAMPFRMGNDSAQWRRKLAGMKRWPNTACNASSRALDEPPLAAPGGARTYLFSSRPWTPEAIRTWISP